MIEAQRLDSTLKFLVDKTKILNASIVAQYLLNDYLGVLWPLVIYILFIQTMFLLY